MKKIGVVIISIIMVVSIGIVVYANNTNTDPIITLSYFEEKISQFKTDILKEIDEKMKKQNEGESENISQNIKYEIVNISKDKQVIFDESTEFIIRRGTATIIDPSNSNGIPNLTTGEDDKNGQTAGLQKLYLVPRSDGRGIHANSDLIIMIRGSYTIK